MTNIVPINNHPIKIRECQGQRVITFREIDEVHERPLGTARRNFYKNPTHFVEGKDYFKFSMDEIRTMGFVDVSSPKGINLITESGYLMLVKSLTDDLAWEVQRQLVDSYFRPQVIQQPTTQIEALLQTVQILAKQEKQILALEETQGKQEQTIQNIKDALLPTDKEWRKHINDQLNKVAKSRDDDYQGTRQESYDLLEARAACDLRRRVKNYKERLFEAGASKTKINGVCRLDVIEQDRRLKEIYSAIVKELAIKYVA
jgi:uncharacterized coiled-coil protein SlyX